MNLLEATTTLIDAAKTYAPENDQVILRSVKRMEKRLAVLQLRAAKARKRNRWKAFWEAMAIMPSGVCTVKRIPVFVCPACRGKLYFGEFCKRAEISGHGRLRSLTCVHCEYAIVEGLTKKPDLFGLCVLCVLLRLISPCNS